MLIHGVFVIPTIVPNISTPIQLLYPSRNRLAATAYLPIISSKILGGLLSGDFVRRAFGRGLLTGYRIHSWSRI